MEALGRLREKRGVGRNLPRPKLSYGFRKLPQGFRPRLPEASHLFGPKPEGVRGGGGGFLREGRKGRSSAWNFPVPDSSLSALHLFLRFVLREGAVEHHVAVCILCLGVVGWGSQRRVPEL